MSLQNSRFAQQKMIMGLRVCLDSANDFLYIVYIVSTLKYLQKHMYYVSYDVRNM